MASDNSLLININGNAQNFRKEIETVAKQTQDLEKTLETTAKGSAIAFAGFAAAIALVTKQFADYETALIGVGKTTNIEGKKLQAFGKEFQKLATKIPLSTNELLGIAQAAGQLGVKGEANLLRFTDTIAKLGVATDLTGEEAATAITRILNVTGEGIETIDKFGSVIVALGNNFAATESEIVRMSTEVARSTAVYNVSATNAAALGTALRSLGVQAELGGSAVGRTFRAIDAAIRGGGQSLENLSKITGIAANDLQKAFSEDSTAVFQQFVGGLSEVEKQGGSTAEALATFGLKGDEILKVLPVLAKNSTILGDALKLANNEYKNSNALNEEARKAFESINSEFVIFTNNATNIATNIGEKLAPSITELLKGTNKLLSEIQNLDDETVDMIASFLKWGAIITSALATVATFAIGILKMRAIIKGLAIAFKVGRVAAVGFTTTLTGGLSLIIGFLPEIITGVQKLLGLFNKSTSTKTIDDVNERLKELNKERDRLANKPKIGGQGIIDNANLKSIDLEIAKLEELKKAKIESENVPVNLARKDNLDDILNAPAIPNLSQDVVNTVSEETKTKTDEPEKTALVDAETQKRIDLAREENEALKQIAKDSGTDLLATDVEFLQRKAAIDAQYSAANKIKNDEERKLAIENLDLKNEAEYLRLVEQEQRLDDLKVTKREERAALEDELRALDVEQRDLFAQEDLQALASSIDSQKEAEKKVAQERLENKIKERNQFKADEIKYGTEIANIKRFLGKQETQDFASATSELAALSQSRNSTLKGIGKAAARVNAAMATAEGAIKAYTSLSGIPVVGPVLGAAAAAAITAYGVERQAQISALAGGGFVPNAVGGSRDRVPTMLEPNELVVPAAVSPNFIQAVGNPSNGQFANDDATSPSGNAGVLRLEGDLISNEQFVSSLATKIKDLQEFDNLRS